MIKLLCKKDSYGYNEKYGMMDIEYTKGKIYSAEGSLDNRIYMTNNFGTVDYFNSVEGNEFFELK